MLDQTWSVCSRPRDREGHLVRLTAAWMADRSPGRVYVCTNESYKTV